VTSASSGLLFAIDPHGDRVTQAVSIGNGPSAVRVLGTTVWVANPPDDTLSQFDPGSGRVRKVNVSGPTALAVVDGGLWFADGGMERSPGSIPRPAAAHALPRRRPVRARHGAASPLLRLAIAHEAMPCSNPA
jgi:hypothetical protein